MNLSRQHPSTYKAKDNCRLMNKIWNVKWRLPKNWECFLTTILIQTFGSWKLTFIRGWEIFAKMRYEMDNYADRPYTVRGKRSGVKIFCTGFKNFKSRLIGLVVRLLPVILIFLSFRGLSFSPDRPHKAKEAAVAGNRTRASHVAGENSTTEPPVLAWVQLFVTRWRLVW